MRILISTLFLLFACNLYGQIASYSFEGNAEDQIGNYDGNISGGTASYESGHLSLGNDGMLILPNNLNENIFSLGSIRIEFDFRLDESNEYALLFSGSTNIVGAPWEENGFRVLIDRTEVVMNYSNADGTGNYEWTGVRPIERNIWHTIAINIDIENSRYNIELDGVGGFQNFKSFLDVEKFRQAVENNLLTVGGFDGQKRGGYTGSFDIDNLAIFAPAPTPDAAISEIYQDLKEVLEGTLAMSDAEIVQKMQFVEANSSTLKYEVVEGAMMAYAKTFEAMNPPIYADLVQHSREGLPPLERALQVAQDYIFQKAFIPENVENLEGLVYEFHEVFPGKISATTTRIPNVEVELNGTYQVDISAELTDQSRVVRPTGYYLAAGDLVTINIPSSIANKGLSVIVGAHFRNMDYDYIDVINRFPDISVEYPLNQTQIKVANPFGGGIYLTVPAGSEVGWFSMTLENAVQAPYFSFREGRKTDVNAWIQQVQNSGAPWVDFESDKFMFTIPIEDVAEVTNPDQIMARWDSIMDAIRIAAGRSLKRPRAEYYSFDTRLVTPAYGAGYPIVMPFREMRGNIDWNPLKVLELYPNPILLHEMGHNHLHPTLDFGADYPSCGFIEAETIPHTLALSIYNNVYGMDINTAFAESFIPNGFDFNEACFDWIITDNFRKGLPMIYDESVPMEDKEMLKYQPRGWAKYGDIVRLFGWEDGLGKVNGYFYTEGEQQTGTACPDKPFIVSREEYIQAACETMEENVTPLFHFWGINPDEELAAAMATFPKSQKVKALIEKYRCEVAPESFEDYLSYHDQMYHRMDYQQPRFDIYKQEFNDDYINDIQAQFDFLLNEYGLIGPESPTNLSASTSGSQINLNWEDESEDETGFIIRSRLLPDGAKEEIARVNANTVDFVFDVAEAGQYEIEVVSVNDENLESNTCQAPRVTIEAEEGTTNIDELNKDMVILYPNPAQDRLTFFNESGSSFEDLVILDMNGKVQFIKSLKGITKTHEINLPELSNGIYLVKILGKRRSLTQKLSIQR